MFFEASKASFDTRLQIRKILFSLTFFLTSFPGKLFHFTLNIAPESQGWKGPQESFSPITCTNAKSAVLKPSQTKCLFSLCLKCSNKGASTVFLDSLSLSPTVLIRKIFFGF